MTRDTKLPKARPYIIIIILSLVFFVPGITTLPVIDRDEAHFAQATRQMLQTGEFFQIRFQEKTRFQKPPGINWLQAASVKLFGDENAPQIGLYRLPSVLGALLSVLFTFLFSRRFIGTQTALLAATFLASSLLLVVESHMAVIDASLLSSVVLMQGALWMIYAAGMEKKKPYCGWAFLFWLAMAYGFVLKGVTPLVGVLSVSSLCLINKRVDWMRGLRLFPGFLLFLFLSFTWLFFVNSAENSNYLLQMLHRDLLPKLQGGHESHGQPPLFHLIILPLTFWPASLFLWQGAAYAFKQRQEKTILFLLAWILPTWIFFELMPTKLPQYVLPTFPALAILMALAVTKDNTSKKPGKWLHLLQILWGILTIGLAVTLGWLPKLMMGHFTFSGIILCIMITILGVVCVSFAWTGAFKRAAWTTLLFAAISYPLIFGFLLPELEPAWISKNAAKSIDSAILSESNPLLVVGYSEPSLVFYLNTKNVQFTDGNTAFLTLQQNKTGNLLIDESSFTTWPKSIHYKVVKSIKGFNYSKGKWIKLLLVEFN